MASSFRGNPGSAKISFFQCLITVLCVDSIPLATADHVPAPPDWPLDRCPNRLHRKNRQQFRETKKLFPKKRSTCDFLSLLAAGSCQHKKKSNKNLHHYQHTAYSRTVTFESCRLSPGVLSSCLSTPTKRTLAHTHVLWKISFPKINTEKSRILSVLH